MLVFSRKQWLLCYAVFVSQIAAGVFLILSSSEKSSPLIVVPLFATSAILGVVLRIALSSKTMIRVRDEDQATYFFLAFATIVIAILLFLLYAPVDRSLLLGVILVGIGAGEGVQHFRIRQTSRVELQRESEYGIRAFIDLDLETHGHGSSGSIKYTALRERIRKGMYSRVALGYFFHRHCSRKLRDRKESAKILVLLLYRLGCFRMVLREVESHHREYGDNSSRTIMNLGALAIGHLGNIDEAITCLQNYADSEEDSMARLYYMLSLTYLYHIKGCLDEALQVSEKILAVKQARKCPMALNNHAYLLCEKSLRAQAPTKKERERVAREARGLIDSAMELSHGSNSASLFDTRGLVCILEEQYDNALSYFAVAASSNHFARFHLALMFMVATDRYYRAEYFLRLTKEGPRLPNPWLDEIVNTYMNIIKDARRQRASFGPTIIQDHLLPFQPKSLIKKTRVVAKEKLVNSAKQAFIFDGIAELIWYLMVVAKKPSEAYAAVPRKQKMGVNV